MDNYPALLKEVKDRIRQAQIKATMSANAEMVFMYWDVGCSIAERRAAEGWGAKIIQRLAQDIRNDLPEIKGFSERNLKRMLAFYNEYSELAFGPTPLAQLSATSDSSNGPTALAQMVEESNIAISPTPLAKLPELSIENQIKELLLLLPWAHNVTLLREKDLQARLWKKSRNVLRKSNTQTLDTIGKTAA